MNVDQQVRDLPQGVFEGANRYDTDDMHVLHLWGGGQSWDVMWPKQEPVEPPIGEPHIVRGYN